MPRARRLLLRVVVVALCLTAGIAIVVLLSGSFDSTSWRVLATTSAVSFFALLSIPAGLLLERAEDVTLGRGSAVLTGSGFVLTLLVTWTPDTPGWLWRAWGVVLTLAVAAAQAAAVEGRRRDDDSQAVRRLTAGSTATGALLAALGTLAILATVDDGGFYRGVAALAVLDVLLVVLAAVLRRGAGPVARTHRVRLDGVLVEAPGRDFAAAVAAAIRQAERNGRRVKRVERA